jgi:hypothetical protein
MSRLFFFCFGVLTIEDEVREKKSVGENAQAWRAAH